MNTKTILATSLVAVFAVSMIFAGTTTQTQATGNGAPNGEHSYLKTLTASLLENSNRYENATPENRDLILEELISIAEERKQILESMIENNTAAVFENSLSKDKRDNLPNDVKPLVEEQVLLEGKLDHLHSDDFANNISKHYYFMTISEDQVSLHFEGTPPDILSGSIVKVQGIKIGLHVAVPNQGNSFEVISASEPVAITQRKTAVILFNFQDNPVQPYTKDHAKSVTFTATNSHNAYYQQISFGKLGVQGYLDSTGDVFGWYTVPINSNNCPYSSASSSARTLAANDGFNINNYDNVIYAFPSTPGCPGWGWAYISGKEAWVQGTYSIRVVTHEEGHNYGVHHASSYSCKLAGVPSIIGDSCTLSEYGDPFDVMGGATSYHMNNFHKGRLNWLDAANTITVTSDGTYTVAPIEQSSAGIQSLRIPRNLDSNGNILDYYYLEFRQPYGFDSFSSTSSVVNGVSIRIAPNYNTVKQTWLLDATPNTSTFTDSALLSGYAFYDPYKSLSITTLDVNSSGATVSIDFTATCVRSNPTMIVSPSSQTGFAGNSLNYNINIVNGDSGACPASSFSIVPTLPLGWTQSPPSPSVSLAPGASSNVSITITSSSSAVESAYTILQTATNNADTSYSTSASATYNVLPPDTTPPAISISGVPDKLPKKGSVKVTANASDANGISLIEIKIDNKLVKTCQNVNTCQYNWNVSPLKTGTTHTVVATATDIASNTATTSLSVTK